MLSDNFWRSSAITSAAAREYVEAYVDFFKYAEGHEHQHAEHAHAGHGH